MPARNAPAAILLLLASPGCLWARGTVEEPIVTELRLEGVKSFDPDDLAGMLATRGPERQLFPPKKNGFRLDPDGIAVDARRVEAWYRARGYYQAKVESTEVIPDGPGRAKVVMRIREGPPVKVRSIAMNGLEQAEPARVRLGKPALQVGEVFNEADFDSTRRALLAALLGTGWARAQVTQRARVLPEEGAVEVVYEVKPGPRLKFGPIFVAGTASVSRTIIRDQAAIDVHTGDWYDPAKLALAQARVFGLGVFAGVRVTPGAPVPNETEVPVVVAVREAPFRTLRFGPGAALESTRWEARGLGGWTHRNFFGQLRKVSLDGRAGYAWLPTGLNRDREGPVAALALQFEQPAAFTRRVDASARVEVERGIELAFDFWAQRLQLGLPLRVAPRWTLVPSYNLEVYELSNTPSGDALTQRPILENCPKKICLLSYLEQRIAYDGRDNPVETRRGYYAALAVQEGVNVGGYGYRYLRFLPEVRGFLPLGPRTVLAARARAGALIPVSESGEPPIVARFFSGGPTSMRGYTTRELGPRADGLPTPHSKGVAVGGNGLLDGSVEVRQGILGELAGVLFVDVGQVAGEGPRPNAYQDVLDLSRLELALGAGIRYATPFGPVRLDVGLLPLKFHEVTGFKSIFTTYFPGAVHVSIGEAF